VDMEASHLQAACLPVEGPGHSASPQEALAAQVDSPSAIRKASSQTSSDRHQEVMIWAKYQDLVDSAQGWAEWEEWEAYRVWVGEVLGLEQADFRT